MRAKEFVSLWVYQINCPYCNSRGCGYCATHGKLVLKTETIWSGIRPYWKATITGNKARLESSVFPGNCLSAYNFLAPCSDGPFQKYDISTGTNGLVFLTNEVAKVRYLVVPGEQSIFGWVKGVPEMYGP
jgi:hypothetical protein